MNSELTPAVYDAIRSLAYQQAGMALGDSRQALVQARIGKRLRILDLENPEQYLHYLERDESGEEMTHLLDVLSTNHTSFFREPRHFELLTEIVRNWKAHGKRSLRLWCAAASTGEEPYTLSLVLQEALGPDYDLRILATDISTRCLNACRRGEYSGERIASVPREQAERWFEREGPNWMARQELRTPLSFARLNLAHVPYAMKGPFDIVFCRNVMIYFDVAGRQKFIHEAERLLPPGGFLFVGTSESLSGIRSGLRSVQPSVHRKEPA
jgi:chemotaxis protein methyltransferase CheR